MHMNVHEEKVPCMSICRFSAEDSCGPECQAGLWNWSCTVKNSGVGDGGAISV